MVEGFSAERGREREESYHSQGGVLVPEKVTAGNGGGPAVATMAGRTIIGGPGGKIGTEMRQV